MRGHGAAREGVWLAAGRGGQLWPLTDECPKPLLRVAGKPLIVWHLKRLAAAGFTDIVINLPGLGRDDRGRAGRRCAASRAHRVQPGEPWPALETGGGLHNALPLLGDAPFLLVNGVFTYIDFQQDQPSQQQQQQREKMTRQKLLPRRWART